MVFSSSYRWLSRAALILFAFFGVALLLMHGFALAQTPYTLPPRTVEDILAVLDQYKPDPAMVEKARADVSAQPPATTDTKELADFYYKRARAARRLGMMRQQIEDFRHAAQYAVGHESRIRIYQDLSNAEWGGGNLLNALKAKQTIINETTLTGWQSSAHASIARMLASMGRHDEAKQYLEKAEEFLKRSSQYKSWWYWQHNNTADVESARADILRYGGKLKDSEAALRRSLAGVEKDNDMNRTRLQMRMDTSTQFASEGWRDTSERRLAMNLRLQGKLIEAETAARNALVRTLKRQGKYAPATAYSVGELSRILFDQGRYHEARLLSRAAAEIWESVGAPPESLGLAGARSAYAATLVAAAAWPEALAEYDKMRADLGKEPLIAENYFRGNVDWALALIRTGKADEAVAMLERLKSTPMVGGYLAMALAQQGKRQRALEEFSKAVPRLISRAPGDETAEGSATARMLRVRRVLEAYIALLADLHKGADFEPQLDVLAESFRVADAARSSNVQRALAESAARAAVPDPSLAALARQEQDARQRVEALSGVLGRLLAAPPNQQLPKVTADIRKEIDALRTDRVKIKQQLEKAFPDYANLIDPKPGTLEQARAALRPGEALISIYVADERTYVWAIPQQGTPALAVVPLGEKAIARTVAQLRTALDVKAVTIDDIPKFNVAAAHGLYVQLLQPLESTWGAAQSLLVVPHRALGEIPFALLPTESAVLPAKESVQFEGYRLVPWLVRRVAVTQLPSVSTLVTLRALAPANAAGRREFIGFGDPYFSKEQQAQALNEGSMQVAALSSRGVRLRNLAIEKVALATPAGTTDDQKNRTSAVPNLRAVANSSTLAQLARLPDTADEILEIARALKADLTQDVFLGAQANEKNVRTLDLSNRKVIVFATHGLVPGDLNGLEQPALALSAPEVSGAEGDGLLTMDKILALKLSADWVVLSACNTASGDGAGVEAVSGLGRAFFYAGARALLVSNWPVETVSAKLLTTDLFRRQAENPELTRAEALRQTMLALIDRADHIEAGPQAQFSYAHPMFWAPFSLVGDGGR